MNPAGYHGRGKRAPFFEGWYYKLVDATEQHRYAIIPGVFLGQDEARNHAFVQVSDGSTGKVTYHSYPLSEFWAAQGALDIRVGPNRFTAHSLALDIHTAERSIQGEVKFPEIAPWPVRVLSPGIMSWYAWVPFMETYHGIVSLDHALVGELEIDGAATDFTAGRGYIEKDWGRSFPSAWVWFQSNHFSTPPKQSGGTSLTASVAIIPWLGNSFTGFIIGLWRGGRLLRFATYTGARLEALRVTDTEVTWIVRDRHYRLEMVAQRAEAGLLRAPALVDMDRRVAEALNATVAVRLYEMGSAEARLLFEDRGRHAGLEVVGDMARLTAP